MINLQATANKGYEIMDTKTANAIVCGCNTLLGSIRADEQQKQIDELKAIENELIRTKATIENIGKLVLG